MSELLSEPSCQAVRLIGKAPLFATIAAGTLGLGIAGNTLVYGVADGVVLDPFPFPDPEPLVGVSRASPRLDRPLSFWENLSPAECQGIEQAGSLERVVASPSASSPRSCRPAERAFSTRCRLCGPSSRRATSYRREELRVARATLG